VLICIGVGLPYTSFAASSMSTAKRCSIQRAAKGVFTSISTPASVQFSVVSENHIRYGRLPSDFVNSSRSCCSVSEKDWDIGGIGIAQSLIHNDLSDEDKWRNCEWVRPTSAPLDDLLLKSRSSRPVHSSLSDMRSVHQKKNLASSLFVFYSIYSKSYSHKSCVFLGQCVA
jgi:hypothetical protein